MRGLPFEFPFGGKCPQSREGSSRGSTEGPWPRTHLAQWDTQSTALTLATRPRTEWSASQLPAVSAL